MKLSEDVIAFIAFYIDEGRLPLVMRGFSVIELSGMARYHEKYEEIVNDSEMIDPMNVPDLIISNLMGDLTRLINAHEIELTDEPTNRLERLVTVTETLFKLLKLEDYSITERILSSSHTPEYKMAQIFYEINRIDVVVSLELLESVSENLLSRLDHYIQSFNEANEDPLIEQVKDDRDLIDFMRFVGEEKCVGKFLFEQGYGNTLTFDELSSISTVDLINVSRKASKGNIANYALNILSILKACTDSCEDPLSFFQDNHEVFTDDPNEVTRIYMVMSGILKDFKLHLEERERMDEDNH